MWRRLRNFADNQSFEEVTSYQAFWGSSKYNMTGHGDPQNVQAVMVADNFLHTLRVQPILGRTFLPAECIKGAASVAMLGNAFWRRQFAGDTNIVGKTITLDTQQRSRRWRSACLDAADHSRCRHSIWTCPWIYSFAL